MATTTSPPELQNPNPTPPADVPQSPVPASSGGDEPNKISPATDDVASVNTIQKKMKRAERFGVPVQLSEVEKRNSRAERFGTAPTACAPETAKSAEELKKKARAERFGIVQPAPAPAPAEEDSKKKARLERFGAVAKTDSLEEEKKKARAIRFSQSQPNSKSPENGRAPIETKTVGEAGVA